MMDLYGPAFDPHPTNDPQIVPQMIPGPELIPPKKVRNSMKSWWMDTYFLNYPRGRKDLRRFFYCTNYIDIVSTA